MKYIKESESPKEVFEAPYKRTIRHIISPWTTGSEHIWLGTSSVEPGFSSNYHSHEDLEETFYCIQGKGQIRVDGKVVDVEINDVVYVKPGELHQLINPSDTEIFKLVCIVTPPFTPTNFSSAHTPK